MSTNKPDTADAGQRAAKKTAAAENKRREAEAKRRRREQQLEEAQAILVRLDAARDGAAERLASYTALVSHLSGFYDEIDKLARGKTLIPTTDLVVEQINDIVRDAKKIISGDSHLDRVREFVPAGDNPVYPDVLLVARSVQQCLTRWEDEVQTREKRLAKTCREARTIVGALNAFLEEGEWPSQEDVERHVTGKVAESWFFVGDDDQSWFDWDRLDRDGLSRLEAPEA